MIGKRLAFNRNLRWATTKLPFLTHYIYLYHQKFRPQLLMGNAQDFLFLAKSGTPFSASSYSNISALFEKHFSVKLTTNDLRKCIVDYFLSLPASGDHTLRYFLFHCKRWGRRLGMLLRKQDMSHIFLSSFTSFCISNKLIYSSCCTHSSASLFLNYSSFSSSPSFICFSFYKNAAATSSHSVPWPS